MRWILPAICILLTARTPSASYWQHGKCLAYLNQTKPFVPNTANHCFTDYSSGIEYCVYSTCPKPPCKRPYHDGHICKTCPGKCQEGERFYEPGSKFLSYDGFRKCHCQRDPGFGAKMFCEVIGEPDPFNFCGIPYPFGYKKGVNWQNTQSFENGVINNFNAHHNSLNNGGGPLQGGVNSIPSNAQTYWPHSPQPTPGGAWPIDFGAGQQQSSFVNNNPGQNFIDLWPIVEGGNLGKQWPANIGNQQFGNIGNVPASNNGGNQWQNNRNGQTSNNGGHWPNNNNNGNNGQWSNHNNGNNGNNGHGSNNNGNNGHGSNNNGNNGHGSNNNGNNGHGSIDNGNNGGQWPNNNNNNGNNGQWSNNNNGNNGNNGHGSNNNNGNNGEHWTNNNNNGNNGEHWPNNNNEQWPVFKFEA